MKIKKFLTDILTKTDNLLYYETNQEFLDKIEKKAEGELTCVYTKKYGTISTKMVTNR